MRFNGFINYLDIYFILKLFYIQYRQMYLYDTVRQNPTARDRE